MNGNGEIKIVLNGSPWDLPGEMNVVKLLELLGFSGKPVVVELDEEAVFPRDYEGSMVRAGARVEIVTLAAGG